MQGILALEQHTASQRQGAVKPGVEDRAAIDLSVQAQDAAFALNLTGRLDTETGRIAMSRDDLETGFGGFLLTHRHSKDGTVIFGEEKLVTSLSAHLVINLFLLEAIGHQYFLDCVNSQEVAANVGGSPTKMLGHSGYYQKYDDESYSFVFGLKDRVCMVYVSDYDAFNDIKVVSEDL